MHTVPRQYTIETQLDLHTAAVAEARERVNAFLNASQLHDKRCVRIIYGKGNTSAGKLPVLMTRSAA
ncbi:MAG: Smr/MutS family protein [Sulfuricaulis sp.]|nr:Smr/MutS family protein [Sulfuricaulis sp.]